MPALLPGAASSSASSSTVQSGSTETVDTSDLTTVMDALFNGIAEDQMPMLMPQEDGSKYVPPHRGKTPSTTPAWP